eukprot:TRINITY_DN19734_c0_g1_i1.p1 TRINITY_DN19734_c0_g1~~TRINITY_DN19734_c0_g1_i1.p1  ORF type:complete len:717 (+),score=218.47 TRINITY_DN19734_c0_g1_i1:61-2211(+)
MSLELIPFGDSEALICVWLGNKGKWFLLCQLSRVVFGWSEGMLKQKINFSTFNTNNKYNIITRNDELLLDKLKATRVIELDKESVNLISLNSLDLFIKSYSKRMSLFTRLYDTIHMLKWGNTPATPKSKSTGGGGAGRGKSLPPNPNEARKRTLTAADKKYVAALQKWLCAWCGQILPSRFEVDHIIQHATGGTDCAENLQALCPNCHADKTEKDRQISRKEEMDKEIERDNPYCWEEDEPVVHFGLKGGDDGFGPKVDRLDMDFGSPGAMDSDNLDLLDFGAKKTSPSGSLSDRTTKKRKYEHFSESQKCTDIPQKCTDIPQKGTDIPQKGTDILKMGGSYLDDLDDLDMNPLTPRKYDSPNELDLSNSDLSLFPDNTTKPVFKNEEKPAAKKEETTPAKIKPNTPEPEVRQSLKGYLHVPKEKKPSTLFSREYLYNKLSIDKQQLSPPSVNKDPEVPNTTTTTSKTTKTLDITGDDKPADSSQTPPKIVENQLGKVEPVRKVIDVTGDDSEEELEIEMESDTEISKKQSSSTSSLIKIDEIFNENEFRLDFDEISEPKPKILSPTPLPMSPSPWISVSDNKPKKPPTDFNNQTKTQTTLQSQSQSATPKEQKWKSEDKKSQNQKTTDSTPSTPITKPISLSAPPTTKSIAFDSNFSMVPASKYFNSINLERMQYLQNMKMKQIQARTTPDTPRTGVSSTISNHHRFESKEPPDS